MRWIIRQWPLVLWAVVIWMFSTHWFTGANTSRIILPVLHWLFPHASAHFLARANFYIRKMGHITEYFIFSLLILRAIRQGRRGWKLAWALAAILVVFGYACLDEWHQSFVPGRDAEFSDALLDTSAGALAQALAGIWIVTRRNRTPQP